MNRGLLMANHVLRSCAAVREVFQQKKANYPHFVDKRLTPLIHIGRI